MTCPESINGEARIQTQSPRSQPLFLIKDFGSAWNNPCYAMSWYLFIPQKCVFISLYSFIQGPGFVLSFWIPITILSGMSLPYFTSERELRLGQLSHVFVVPSQLGWGCKRRQSDARPCAFTTSLKVSVSLPFRFWSFQGRINIPIMTFLDSM